MTVRRASRVLVFSGGDPVESAHIVDLPRDAYVVAADSGAIHATRLGFAVDRLVGDLDSTPAELVTALEAAGTVVERHPTTKDQTDLALAIDVALALEPAAITIVGGHGGRLDHLLANVLLLASDAYAGVAIDARMGAATVTVVRGRRQLTGGVDDLVSLLAVNGRAEGVSTEGLLFPLRAATLRPGSSWGVSNQLAAPTATVEVARGVVLAVQPGERGALTDAGSP